MLKISFHQIHRKLNPNIDNSSDKVKKYFRIGRWPEIQIEIFLQLITGSSIVLKIYMKWRFLRKDPILYHLKNIIIEVIQCLKYAKLYFKDSINIDKYFIYKSEEDKFNYELDNKLVSSIEEKFPNDGYYYLWHESLIVIGISNGIHLITYFKNDKNRPKSPIIMKANTQFSSTLNNAEEFKSSPSEFPPL